MIKRESGDVNILTDSGAVPATVTEKTVLIYATVSNGKAKRKLL
jgi:hypothetical protein